MTTPSNKLLLISHFNAIALACLALAGSVMLLPLGAAIHAQNIQIVGGKEMIEDTAVVGGNCFIAAIMYAGLFVFALWQVRASRTPPSSSPPFTLDRSCARHLKNESKQKRRERERTQEPYPRFGLAI
ncbi:hypothetical protein BC830DRAFT_1119705 [Chytriomyces sp. MP71]|nr:hypothetical protein BC830DRAFT_1119705 [Chytriomyces sp. MP71]